jgi:hypothetical protein
VILFTAVIGHATPASAPQTERPGCSVDNPIELPKDLSGLSLKVPRVRVVHSTGARLAGGSMYLQQVDPWLGSAWGRSLFQRSFRDRDGVSGEIKREGRIEERFTVAGRDTGVERWNCERLFQTPGQIEGPVTGPLGERVTSFALTNLRAAYGLDLPRLKNSDGDGFPDVNDPAPHRTGYRDGAR